MDGLTAQHMKSMVEHLARAAVRVEQREEKKAAIHQRIEELRRTSLFKGSTKKEIEEQINSLRDELSSLFKTEKQILDEQKAESKIIKQLQDQVSELTQALHTITQETKELIEKKDEEIAKLKDHNHTLQLALKELKEHHPEHKELIDGALKKDQIRKELQEKLHELEEKHKQLSKSKSHDPKELKRIESLIKELKKKLK
ncbi:hypothetical protein D6774_00980 [Candidatus Woesearchaeota archaeon]|nr:MAG: hypothetical protein D6774_00980 [Candidatus Woesearchaeota archaeon]